MGTLTITRPTAVVQVINTRTNAVVENHTDLSELEAYGLARRIAASYADAFGNVELHQAWSGSADQREAFDRYNVLVFDRDDSGRLGWRGAREVDGTLVIASGRCAY